ncbi:esterase-like activity of phytase family protein [Kordiimonas gwangyangensis]|uniref:esterase-like activity of phytase family protein n=1 Tax=Kordiimonas gwangyangensis TaxID=288022 RepID=UPI00036D5C44|nr:esterase-like activity of phytase family protein [Kordiimonas gwangyangensis]
MSRHFPKLVMLVTAALMVTAFTVYRDLIGNKPEEVLVADVPVKITARPLPLLETDRSVFIAGKLRYRAGWALTADNENFGGFSGLVVTADGKLVAISDRGDWLEAEFDPNSDAPLTAAHMRPFSAEAQGMSKHALDSESVVAYGGGYLVSFEGDHRLLEVAADRTVRLSGYSAHLDVSGVNHNSGFEAITLLGDTLVALPERGVDYHGNMLGRLVTPSGSDSFYFRPPTNFAPTDAATMQNGDILVLLRSYSLLNGVAAKLVRIPAGAIKPGASVTGEELLHLDPPYTVDNMEGLDVIERDGEAPLIVLISDDNFRSSQRTLLLVFSLETA